MRHQTHNRRTDHDIALSRPRTPPRARDELLGSRGLSTDASSDCCCGQHSAFQSSGNDLRKPSDAKYFSDCLQRRELAEPILARARADLPWPNLLMKMVFIVHSRHSQKEVRTQGRVNPLFLVSVLPLGHLPPWHDTRGGGEQRPAGAVGFLNFKLSQSYTGWRMIPTRSVLKKRFTDKNILNNTKLDIICKIRLWESSFLENLQAVSILMFVSNTYNRLVYQVVFGIVLHNFDLT